MKTITVKNKATMPELKQMAKNRFGNFVKAVVDIKKEVIVLDAEMHADQEQLLLEKNSQQKDLWGINLYPDIKNEDFIEFDSMINLRPSQNNRTRGIDDLKTRKTIIKIVNKLIKK